MLSNRPALTLLILSALTSSGIARADDTAAVRERLDRATEASSLDALNSRSWHLKLGVTIFDAKGKNPVDATIEYWKSGPETLRVITSGASTQTDLTHDGKNYRATSGDAIPSLATDAFDAFLHPGPMPADFANTKLELHKQSFGKVSLDCIMLTEPIRPLTRAPLGLFPTYCLAADRLAATYDFGSYEIAVQSAGRFLDHDVALEFEVGESKVVVARVKVLSLVTFTPSQDTFLPGTQLVAIPNLKVRTSSDVVPGLRIGGDHPIYPEKAEKNNISGIVMLRGIIGRDGHLHRLRVISPLGPEQSAPDPDLAMSALGAIRSWTYKPYLLNGAPVEMPARFVVKFDPGHISIVETDGD